MSDHVLPPPTAAGPLLPWLLAALAPMSRSKVKDLLRAGRVSVNGSPVTRHDHPLRPDDRVTLTRSRATIADDPLVRAGVRVVYEDDALVVIDKPPGLLTVATASEKLATAFVLLSAHLAARRAGRPFVVHRLDRDTSGLLLFARTEGVRDRLQADWSNVTKTYLAVTEGIPDPAEGVIDNFLVEGRDLRVRSARPDHPDARRAVTRYRVVGGCGRLALVEVGLETGRKHQIRVHLAGLGCPVIGDAMYGATADPAGRLGLHAWRLAFCHPIRGTRTEVEAALPAELRRPVQGPARRNDAGV